MCGNNNGSAGDAVYGLGVIGAAIYFISTATGFWMGALGILKALVWPAFFVYEALKFLMWNKLSFLNTLGLTLLLGFLIIIPIDIIHALFKNI